MSRRAEPKFKAMKVWQKIAFVCKLIVFVGSFGFAYPNIFID